MAGAEAEAEDGLESEAEAEDGRESEAEGVPLTGLINKSCFLLSTIKKSIFQVLVLDLCFL